MDPQPTVAPPTTGAPSAVPAARLAPLGELPRPGVTVAAPVRSERRTLVLSLVMGAAVGGALPLAFGDAMKQVMRLVPQAWIGLPTIALTMVLAIAVHELGHVLGGVLRGWRFVLWNVGPVAVTRTDRGMRVRLHGVYALCGGIALAAPHRWQGADRMRRDNLWMVAGGPAASWLLVAAGALTWWLGHDAAGALARWAAFTGAFSALFSALIGVATLIPGRMGPVLVTDGHQVRELLRPGVERTPTFALRALRLLSTWLRPREWPPEIVRLAQALDGSATERATAHWYAAFQALDRGDRAEAHDHMVRSLAAMGEEGDPLMAKAMAADFEALAAVMLALTTGDADGAQALLDSALARGDANPASVPLARAAVAWARGDAAGARTHADEAQRLMRESPIPVGDATFRPALELLRAA